MTLEIAFQQSVLSRTSYYVILHSPCHQPIIVFVFSAHNPNRFMKGQITFPVTLTVSYSTKKRLGKSNFAIMSHHSLLRSTGSSMPCFEYVARHLTNDHQNPFTVFEKPTIHTKKQNRTVSTAVDSAVIALYHDSSTAEHCPLPIS